MNLSSLQILTWSTVAGASISALALALVSGESISPERGRTVVDGPAARLPIEPTAAGRREPPAASAGRESVSRHTQTVVP